MNKFDPTKPVQTRAGNRAKILKADMRSRHYQIVAVIDDEDGTQYVETYTSEGRFGTSGLEHSTDLVNVPEKKKMHVNVYEEPTPHGCGYESRDRADRLAGELRVACVLVEYYEGQGLNDE